jgi:HEAT repeats
MFITRRMIVMSEHGLVDMRKLLCFPAFIMPVPRLIYTICSISILLFSSQADAQPNVRSDSCSDTAIAHQIQNLRSSETAPFSSLIACGEAAVPGLIVALEDDDDQVRSLVAYTLGQMGRVSRRALPALIERLSDQSADVRGSVAYALGQVAPDNARVVRRLVRQAASDTDATVRDITIEALLTPKSVPTLLEIFATQNDKEAEASAQLLLKLGSSADPDLTTESLPKILVGLSHVPWYIQSNVQITSYRVNFANYVFQQLGTNIVPTLVSGLSSSDEAIKEGAIRALLQGYSEGYFDRQSIESALPTVTQIFRNSRVYTLWHGENQTLVMTASGRVMSASGDDVLAAQKQVSEIISGDRTGLSALALLGSIDGLFWENLQRENEVAFELVNLLAFSVIAADGVQITGAIHSYQRSSKPAICRLPFARFLWRCR